MRTNPNPPPRQSPFIMYDCGYFKLLGLLPFLQLVPFFTCLSSVLIRSSKVRRRGKKKKQKLGRFCEVVHASVDQQLCHFARSFVDISLLLGSLCFCELVDLGPHRHVLLYSLLCGGLNSLFLGYKSFQRVQPNGDGLAVGSVIGRATREC